jgi:hypothetical protein
MFPAPVSASLNINAFARADPLLTKRLREQSFAPIVASNLTSFGRLPLAAVWQLALMEACVKSLLSSKGDSHVFSLDHCNCTH